MYEKAPLELKLDPKNPRFTIPNTGDSQANIRSYLLLDGGVLC